MAAFPTGHDPQVAGRWSGHAVHLPFIRQEHTMALDSLHDLFLNELKDVYNAEKQIIRALPRMAKAAQSPELQQAFTKHLKETEGHVQRLEQIFADLGTAARGKKCKGMEGLIEEGKEILEEDGAAEVIDAALISAAQRVEHYEMAAYGCLRTYAQLLGLDQADRLLQQTLDEEETTDRILTEIGEGGVNQAAVAVGADEEEEEEEG
jgi:ferritin-like metal-binding protein YciE